MFSFYSLLSVGVLFSISRKSYNVDRYRTFEAQNVCVCVHFFLLKYAQASTDTGKHQDDKILMHRSFLLLPGIKAKSKKQKENKTKSMSKIYTINIKITYAIANCVSWMCNVFCFLQMCECVCIVQCIFPSKFIYVYYVGICIELGKKGIGLNKTIKLRTFDNPMRMNRN